MDVPRLLAAVALTLAIAACQSSTTSSADAFVPLPDAAIGVVCSGAVCSTDLGCCAATGGQPTCMASATATCSGHLLKCDGPEDCTGGTICCNLNNGGAECQTTSACEADGTITCGSANDCPDTLPNCCNRVCGADACNFW